MNGDVFGENFICLCEKLSRIPLTDSLRPEPPWKSGSPVLEEVERCVAAGIFAIPSAYRQAFIEPLVEKLPVLIADFPKSALNQRRLETCVCAVYQHAQDYPWRPHLHRFLALVSDLYRSFLKKYAAGAVSGSTADTKPEVSEILPPLATFKYCGKDGPFTFAVDDVRKYIGGSVGVVSLPAVYADDPILWLWTAHETGGHDVVHAVPGLLTELQDGVRQELAAMSVRGLWPGELGSLWSYWMNEAVADIYGVLNIGPMFGPGVTAATAALRHQRDKLDIPKIWMDSDDASGTADPHPTDILRIHLVLGAVESLVGLNPGKRQHYAAELETIADLCKSADVVGITGYPLSHGGRVNAVVPLDQMQESARRVGRYVSTTELKALGGRSIRQIETWDDHDEEAAESVREALVAGRGIGALGDDAHLFAGAIMHLLRKPVEYDRVKRTLAKGLDQSFADDALWQSVHSGVGRSGLIGAAPAAQHRPTP